MDLEQRIKRLEDIEEIKSLQAKYQRCLDSRDFDGLAECFSDDVITSYGNDSMKYEGKDNVLNFLMSVMSIKMPSAHLIHGAEIDWINEEFAKGIWYLEDHLIHKKYLVKLNGTAIYHVEYKKIDNNWKISSIGYERNYEYVELRGPINLMTLNKTTLLDKFKKDDLVLGKYGKIYQEKYLKKRKKEK